MPSWLLSGRQLGLLRALLVQVEAGIANEAMVTSRAIHEVARMLFAFSVPDEEDAVGVWLDDEGKYGYFKQGAARAAQERYERQLGETMERSGIPPIRETRAMIEEIYDRLSRVAHSRRSSVVDAVWERGRRMAYGHHPSAIRRAGYAEWARRGRELGRRRASGAYSRPRLFVFVESIAPLIKSIEAVRETSELDEGSIRRAAGTG